MQHITTHQRYALKSESAAGNVSLQRTAVTSPVSALLPNRIIRGNC